jgi:hypothetical protein
MINNLIVNSLIYYTMKFDNHIVEYNIFDNLYYKERFIKDKIYGINFKIRIK